MRDALYTKRTWRYVIGTILTGNVVRTAQAATGVANAVASGGLVTLDGTSFGLFDAPAFDESVSITATLAVLTSPNNPWTAADVGKAIDVQGAGAAGATLRSRIKTFTNPGSVILEDNAGTTVAATATSTAGLAVWGNALSQTRNLPVHPNEAGTTESAAASVMAALAGAVARSGADRLADELHVKDFGAKGNGVTDDYAAIVACIAKAAAIGVGVVFDAGTYAVGTALSITNALANVPRYIKGHGATILALAGVGVNPLLTIDSPHGMVVGFRIDGGLVLDGAGVVSKCLYIHGCQYATFDVRVKRANGYGAHIQGEPGFGVYYSKLDIIAGGSAYADGNASTGILVESINNTGGNYVANVVVRGQSIFNKGHGVSIDYASLTLLGFDSEANDLFGVNVDHTHSLDVLGGYSENNHQMRATRADGTGNGTTDYSFQTTANTIGCRIVGGRHIGGLTGTFRTDAGFGNWYQPDADLATLPGLDASGNLQLMGALRGDGAAGIHGAIIQGVGDATAPVAGQVGELIEAIQSVLTNAAATGTYLALISIALTPGDWDIEATAEVSNNAATVTGAAQIAVGAVSGAGTGCAAPRDICSINASVMSGGQIDQVAMPRKRVQITANTTYYLNVLSRFSAGTPQWTGYLSARRVR